MLPKKISFYGLEINHNEFMKYKYRFKPNIPDEWNKFSITGNFLNSSKAEDWLYKNITGDYIFYENINLQIDKMEFIIYFENIEDAIFCKLSDFEEIIKLDFF